MNQGTQNFLNFDNGGGTVLTQIVTVGTIQSGTISVLPNLPGGTVNMLSAGTLTSVGTVPGIGVLTSVTNLASGTLLNSGTTTGVGTITNIGVINNAGTIAALPNLPGGSIVVTAGTTVNNGGSVSVQGLAGSAAAIIGNPIYMAGQASGTINPLLTDTSGHIHTDIETGTITSVTNLASGTLLNSGTTTGVGVVSMLSAGTVSMINAGTITSSGTTTGVGVVSMLSAGTLTTIPNIPGGTIGLVTTVTNLSNGTIQNSGTVTGVGVVSVLANGTIGAGTVSINAGTVKTDARNTQNLVTYGTQISGTAAIAGTIIGSASVGAGTSLWINDFSIINPYGTVLTVLGFGTAQQGTNVIFRGILGTQTGPGIEKQYSKLTNSGMANQDLVLSLGGAGTVDLSISYIISA